MEKESFLCPCQGEDGHTGVWCHRARSGVAFSSPLPLCDRDTEHQAPSPGSVPTSPSKPRGSPGQGTQLRRAIPPHCS